MNEGDKQMSQMCFVLKLLAVSISNIEQALKVNSTIARAPSAQERELVPGSGAQDPSDGGQFSGDGPRGESEEEIWEHALNPTSEPTYKHGGRHKAQAGQRQQQQASSGSGITSEQLAALLTGFRGDMEAQVHKIVSRQMEKLLGQVQKTVPALVASELGMADVSKGRAKGTLEAATSPLKAESKEVEEEEAALHIQSGLRPAGEAASEMIQRQQELDTKLNSLLQTIGALRASQEEILSVCKQSYTLKEQDWMRNMLDKSLQSADDALPHEHEREDEHINSDVTTSSDDKHQHFHPPRRHHRTHRHTSRMVKAASDNKADAARSALRRVGARPSRRSHSFGDELQDWGPVRNAAGIDMAVPRQARDRRAPDAAPGGSGASELGAPHRSPRSGSIRPEQQRGAGAMTWQHSVCASPSGVAPRGADTVMVSLSAPPNAYPRFSTAPVTAPGHNAALHAAQDPARSR